MEFLRKFAKELSIFGLVIVIFLGLFIFRNLTHEDVTTISTTQLTAKMESSDDFVVLVGDYSDTNISGYISEVVEPFLQAHSGTKIYYVDTQSMDDETAWIRSTFATTDGTSPQYFVIKQGAVSKSYSGTVSYIRLNQLFD